MGGNFHDEPDGRPSRGAQVMKRDVMKHPQVVKASAFAYDAHYKQKRKYTGEPYWNHCASVAAMLAEYDPDDLELVVAGFLHDTLEDTATTRDDIKAAFGHGVMHLVHWVTDVPLAHGNRAQRKEADRARLNLAPARAQTLKLADLIDNTASIVEHDPGFAHVYIGEKIALLGVLTRGN